MTADHNAAHKLDAIPDPTHWSHKVTGLLAWLILSLSVCGTLALPHRFVVAARLFTLCLLMRLVVTAHEMSNPEYWYEGYSFVLVFIGVTIVTAVYLWRRSVVTIWLGDGLGRFVEQLF